MINPERVELQNFIWHLPACRSLGAGRDFDI